MTTTMLEPVTCCGRRIITVVRESVGKFPGGLYAAAEPVALIIGEGDRWFFVAFDEGWSPEDIPGICGRMYMDKNPESP